MYEQQREMKKQYPNVLILFRLATGFYQFLDEDAETASKILGLPLVRWSEESPTVWIVFRTEKLEEYLRKLLQAGKRVAVCEQVKELPKGHKAKRVVSNDA